MGSKPSRLSRFPLLELFFMRIPSSTSLILASLIVSSSLLSALAAPVGGGQKDSSSYAAAVLSAQQHVQILPGGDDTIAQPNNHLLVDKVTAPLAVSPIVKMIPDILRAILNLLVDKDTSKARGGDDAASEYSPMRSPAAGHQGVPVAGPNPPAGFPSQLLLPRGHAGRQTPTGGNSKEGSAGGNAPCACPP